MRQTVQSLKDAGHTIIHKNMMDTKKHVSAYYVVATAEASANLSRYDGIRYGNRVEGKNLSETYKIQNQKVLVKRYKKELC